MNNRQPYVVYLRDDDGSATALKTLKDHSVNTQLFIRKALNKKAEEFENNDQ